MPKRSYFLLNFLLRSIADNLYYVKLIEIEEEKKVADLATN